MCKKNSAPAVCRECGADLTGRKTGAGFCGRPCRNAYTNRRSERGRQFYDLFMAIRYERKLAKELELWTKLCRMAQDFKEEDDAHGRKSWQDVREVIAKRPDLSCITSTIR